MLGLKCGADVDGSVGEGSESGMLESQEKMGIQWAPQWETREQQWDSGGLPGPGELRALSHQLPLYPNKAPPSPHLLMTSQRPGKQFVSVW